MPRRWTAGRWRTRPGRPRRDEIARIWSSEGRLEADRSAPAENASPKSPGRPTSRPTRQALAAHGSLAVPLVPYATTARRWPRSAGMLKSELPRDLAERLKIVDEVIEAQAATGPSIDDPNVTQLGRDAFGTLGRARSPTGPRWPRSSSGMPIAGPTGSPGDHRGSSVALGAARACKAPLEDWPRQTEAHLQPLAGALEVPVS